MVENFTKRYFEINFKKWFVGKYLWKSSFLVKFEAYNIQPPILPEMNFFTGVVERFYQLFRNNYFKEHLRKAASVRFSCDFADNFFAYVSAS